MGDKTFRWGILGSGYIAAKVLSLGIKRCGVVAAVGSRSLEKAREFATLHGIEKAYGTYQQVLDDSEIDAVYLALPTNLHEEWTIKAAKAKKHILCEKPVAANRTTVQNMIKACEENKVVFMDGTWWQHHPRTSALSDFLYPPTGDAQIGKIRSVISTFTFSDPNMSASNIRAQPSVEPLGCVGDIGWYAIRFSLFAYNYKLPESVVGVITGRHPETGAITQFSGIMVYADNQSATFDCGFNAALNQRSEISAEKGTVRIPDTFMPFGGRKEDGLDSKTRFYYAMDGAGNGHREVWEEVVQDVEIGVQEYMIKDFHACIEGKLDWKVFAKQTQAIHAIMDAALQSANNGSVPVKL